MMSDRSSWWTALIVGYGLGAASFHFLIPRGLHGPALSVEINWGSPDKSGLPSELNWNAGDSPRELATSEITMSPIRPVNDDDGPETHIREVPREAATLESEPLEHKPAPVADFTENDPNHVIVESEIGHLSEQDREVWKDTLKGMSPEAATGILRMWKNFGQAGRPFPFHVNSGKGLRESKSSAGTAPSLSSRPEGMPSPYFSPEAAPSRSAERQLLSRLNSLRQYNLANQYSCGFQRLEPILIEGEWKADASSTPPRWGGVRIATQPGDMIPTARRLDLAIEGPAYFSVQNPEDPKEMAVTRKGELGLDANQRLTIRANGWIVQPEITVPAETTELEIAEDGEVLALIKQERKSLGKLNLVSFLDATSLQPMGSGLLRMTTGSGSANPAEPTTFKIWQGKLEGSNVNADVERRLMQLDAELLGVPGESA